MSQLKIVPNKSINVIETLNILTDLESIVSEEDEDYNMVRDSILSYIIASGNILNGITTIPYSLERNVDILIDYMNEVGTRRLHLYCY